MGGLVAELADVDGVGWDGHGFEVHGAHGVVGTHGGAKEAAFEVEAFHVVFEGELDGLRSEVADDDHGWGYRADYLWFADPDEDVLVVVIEEDTGAGCNSGVAVVESA